ncbi:MAG TPA: hypothetical protein VJU13_03120 [Candidatus Nitrosocosmicus sp.]|nr:hypothetical protein [Candidatus Nitrosocosmicus sp.]
MAALNSVNPALIAKLLVLFSLACSLRAVPFYTKELCTQIMEEAAQ